MVSVRNSQDCCDTTNSDFPCQPEIVEKRDTRWPVAGTGTRNRGDAEKESAEVPITDHRPPLFAVIIDNQRILKVSLRRT